MKSFNLENYYSSKDANDQVQFILAQTGKGYDSSAKIISALNRDRNVMYGMLQEVAFGKFDMDKIKEFVERYGRLTTNHQY